MGFFKKDYNKPGPGVPKNAPRKTGASRLFEILGRDFGNLIKLNLIYFPFILIPALCLVFVWLSFLAGVGLYMLIAAILGAAACIPLGGATSAMYYCITKMQWDEPGFIWHDFKKTLKENFRGTMWVGVIYGVLTGAQTIAFLFYQTIGGGLGIALMAIFFFSVLLIAMVMPYFFTQAPYLDMGAGDMLRNSLMMALGFAPKSLMGAILGSGLIIAQVLFFPFTFITLVLFGFTLPCLFALTWVWPVVDKQFEIEKTLRKRKTEKGEAEDLERDVQFAEQYRQRLEEAEEAKNAESADGSTTESSPESPNESKG